MTWFNTGSPFQSQAFRENVANFSRVFTGTVADRQFRITSGMSDRIIVSFDPSRDRGVADQVTTIDALRIDVAALEAPVPSATGAEFRLTRNILRQLGSCATYVRRFSETFPLERYPDGIEINEQVCVEYVTTFDWEWAVSRMLTHEGRLHVDRIVRSRSEANRRYGNGDRRRAAAFGHIFQSRPDLRNPELATMRTRAEAQADRDAISELEIARANIATRNADITRYERHIVQLRETNQVEEARMPALEALAAEPLRRQAELKLREAKQSLVRMHERVKNGEKLVVDAQAEVERLAALTTAKTNELTAATAEVSGE